ncbi:MAG: hypothetical protein ABFD92_21330 [Planctomycetaceae bacterium]
MLVYLLTIGKRVTAQDAARIVGITDRSARDMLNRISRMVPIYRDDDGKWTICTQTAKGQPPNVP